MPNETQKRFLSNYATLATLIALNFAASALAQQTKATVESDPYPTLIKVYSKDGKESLSGTCVAKDPDTARTIYSPRDRNAVNDVTCSVMTVRYLTPNERPKEASMPATYDEFVKQSLKENPKLAEGIKRNPNIVRDEWNKATEEMCSNESIANLQKRMKEMQMGPKMKGFYQKWLDACASKDFKAVIDNMNSLNGRTCSMWIQNFSLDFKRIGKGKWLSNPGPQGLCNVVETYELDDIPYGMARTVKSTVITVGGTKAGEKEFPEGACKLIAEERKEPMTWSLTNLDEFEPQCDFIKHDYISAPLP